MVEEEKSLWTLIVICICRVIEEGGVCPICRRATRKVRRIFSV